MYSYFAVPLQIRKIRRSNTATRDIKNWSIKRQCANKCRAITKVQAPCIPAGKSRAVDTPWLVMNPSQNMAPLCPPEQPSVFRNNRLCLNDVAGIEKKLGRVKLRPDNLFHDYYR